MTRLVEEVALVCVVAEIALTYDVEIALTHIVDIVLTHIAGFAPAYIVDIAPAYIAGFAPAYVAHSRIHGTEKALPLEQRVSKGRINSLLSYRLLTSAAWCHGIEFICRMPRIFRGKSLVRIGWSGWLPHVVRQICPGTLWRGSTCVFGWFAGRMFRHDLGMDQVLY